MMKSGSSYLSQSELVLTSAWVKDKGGHRRSAVPSGQVDKLSNISSGQTVTIEEERRDRCAAVRKEVDAFSKLSY